MKKKDSFKVLKNGEKGSSIFGFGTNDALGVIGNIISWSFVDVREAVTNTHSSYRVVDLQTSETIGVLPFSDRISRFYKKEPSYDYWQLVVKG